MFKTLAYFKTEEMIFPHIILVFAEIKVAKIEPEEKLTISIYDIYLRLTFILRHLPHLGLHRLHKICQSSLQQYKVN